MYIYIFNDLYVYIYIFFFYVYSIICCDISGHNNVSDFLRRITAKHNGKLITWICNFCHISSFGNIHQSDGKVSFYSVHIYKGNNVCTVTERNADTIRREKNNCRFCSPDDNAEIDFCFE